MEAVQRENSLSGQVVEKALQSGKRHLALDVFRGLTICLMIIVNTPGKGAPFYPFLVHAKWFGFTMADIVFPSFLFAVGTSMSFSFNKARLDDIAFLKKILYRSALVFLLGFLMYWFPFVRQSDEGTWNFIPLAHTRIMGVLQRIALCYLCTSLLVRWCSGRVQIFIALAILLGYWAILYVFGDAGQELSMAGNAITKFDLWLLGENHVYKKDLMPFDPEGVLSTLPAILNVLAGYWIGRMIQRQRNDSTTLTYLIILGISAILAGSLWNMVFPISKKLWTSPFVLFSVGCDILLITALIYLKGFKLYTRVAYFFTVPGKNPLFIYLLSELLYIVLVTIKTGSHNSLFSWVSIEVFQKILPGPAGALLTAIVFMLFCWSVAWWLDRRKIYIKI